MYLLYPSLARWLFIRSCLHLYRITRPSSLESTEWRETAQRPRPTGPLIYQHFSSYGNSRVEKFSYFSFFKANVPRINVMTLRNGDDTIILEVTGSPPVIKRSLMIILGLSLGGCESRIIEFLFRPFTKCTPVVFLRWNRDGDELTLGRDEHYTLVSFDNFISYSALFPAVRFYVLHGQTNRYLSILSERLVIREKNVWYLPSRLRTLRYRTRKKRKSKITRDTESKKEKERERESFSRQDNQVMPARYACCRPMRASGVP
ncbi:hypothetical protein ALC56_12122 [Trachymyrmex septentrionalis]|uniref:Uncharacterized protein n=1 Tax=Trachymyrmex septentrionalis TaxID=34720 RepID=A0A195EYP0_9HYME|nr:hypothetical protein ALC56_12122 [Trachymyrmex septentrionalis]